MNPVSHSLVIFDLDGTLLDSLAATLRCFQEALAPALGAVPDRDEILGRFGPADHRIVADWVGPARASAALDRLYACYARELGRIRPVPGAVALIDRLRARGRRVALFTGRGRPSTDRLLETAGLARCFETTVCGEEVRRPKPHPDGLRKILAHFDLPPREAVYVGDSLLDLRAAASAGIDFAAALWVSREPALLEADPRVRAETVQALGRILGLA